MMSRLIVKNLPTKVDPEKLKQKFSEKGEVTDVQLRFTPEGKFRKFAFVGFKTPEQAAEAIKHFDNTFFNSSRMKVELCTDLGSTEKPRAWSKHTKKVEEEKIDDKEKTKKKEKKKKKAEVDQELLKKLGKHKDKIEFREFLEVHSAEKVLELCNEDSGVEGSDNEEEERGEDKEEESEVSAAHAPISDAEYLKSKMKGGEPKVQLVEDKPQTKKHERLFTVKVKNLPKDVKKHEIRELFKPVMAASVRRARGLLGIAYVGFKTEKDMRKALIKNRSFIKGKQLSVSECKDKQEPETTVVPEKWKRQEEGMVGEENVGESGRIFLRNLCYSAKEDEVEQLFSKYGPLSEVNLPIDRLTRKMKGYGTVTFLLPEHAVAAYTALDGTVFQGRMLHLLPGKSKDEEQHLDSKNYKQMKEARLRKTAGHSHNWNTLFLGRNAIANVIAETYKASKQAVLTGSEAAVRLALGETQLVASTRQFLTDQGIYLDAFNQVASQRSKNIILIKNLPANTTSEEIRDKFDKFGVLGRVVLPPSGIMAVVEFEEPSEARSAFTKLAYTKFKNLPLYLEWAPQNTFTSDSKKPDMENEVSEIKEEETSENTQEETVLKEEESDDEEEPEPDTTLYVKNLSFATTEEHLKQHFSYCGKLANVTVSRKRDPKNPAKTLSLGYGFVQFYLRTSVNKALAELQGSVLDGHILELKRSDRTAKVLAVSNRKSTNIKKQTGSKILVRNVPFQANVAELKQLFGTFGELKFVRMPKKMAGTGKHRGFCFVEFTSKHEAKAAMKALCQSTHLYGRRLVLEWAAADDTEVEAIRKRTADHFHSDVDPTVQKSKKAVADMNMEEEEDED